MRINILLKLLLLLHPDAQHHLRICICIRNRMCSCLYLNLNSDLHRRQHGLRPACRWYIRSRVCEAARTSQMLRMQTCGLQGSGETDRGFDGERTGWGWEGNRRICSVPLKS
eukprot:6194473-Pleurochrysis_carterae.AAC.4